MSTIDSTTKTVKVNQLKSDFMKRVEHYQSIYEPMACGKELGLVNEFDGVDHETEFSFIKCIDFGERMILNNIKG